MKKGIKHQGGQETALHRAYEGKSGRVSQSFGRTVGVTRIAADSGKSHSQNRNVCQGVQIGGAVCFMNPKTFLAGSLKTGVVAFTFGAKCIKTLELRALPVNGKPIVIGDRLERLSKSNVTEASRHNQTGHTGKETGRKAVA